MAAGRTETGFRGRAIGRSIHAWPAILVGFLVFFAPVAKTSAASLSLGGNCRNFTPSAASGKELKVTADVSWTAKSSVSWLTLKKTSGSGNGTILYNVAANTGTGQRTGKITV
ncbi:MAG: BACON domain-containing protein, partial [Kiritimatiellae bacterium]|nr:BACON domain-containing protein [Kiritimatiellia bacterium]